MAIKLLWPFVNFCGRISAYVRLCAPYQWAARADLKSFNTYFQCNLHKNALVYVRVCVKLLHLNTNRQQQQQLDA